MCNSGGVYVGCAIEIYLSLIVTNSWMSMVFLGELKFNYMEKSNPIWIFSHVMVTRPVVSPVEITS